MIVVDPFWANDLTILFREDRILEFFITKDLLFEEKLNAIVRFGIYTVIVLSLYQSDPKFLLLAAIPLGLTYFIYHNFSKEDYAPGIPKEYKEKFDSETEILVPTKNNPFMNPSIMDTVQKNAPNYSKKTPEAAEIRGEIEKNFDINLYQDVNDVFETQNSRRQFYTVPSNNDDIKDFLYGDMRSGKEDQYENGRNLHESLQTSNRNEI